MNSKKFSEAMGELDTKYVDEAISYKKKAQNPVWVKWGAVAACLAFVCAAAICLFPNNNGNVTTPGTADAAPMIYVNDTLYKQSVSQASFNELKDDFVYLGVIESDVTNFQGSNDAGNYLDGIPRENFQANHPIVGAEVYQYGENIVVEIEGKYWLYENCHNTDLDGNPNGYDPLPNNQTSGEEASEQDPAAT